jgi:hypothetical protein
MTRVPTFTATVYAGLRVGADLLSVSAAEAIVQQFVDDVKNTPDVPGGCVTVTQTTYIYGGGSEPGVAVGFINYPRVPSDPIAIRARAERLASLLLAGLGQQRVTVVFPDETVMLSAADQVHGGEAMTDNMMPGDNSGAYPDEQEWTDDRMADAFRAGAAQMREMLARFVEQGGDSPATVIAQSMRLNWVPNWGKDPGKQDEVYDDLWTTI